MLAPMPMSLAVVPKLEHLFRLVQKLGTQLLLSHGTNVNSSPTRHGGRTTLQAICAPETQNTELVKLLLDNGADVNAPVAGQAWLNTVVRRRNPRPP
ncbi:hypothetical protein BGZ60DRAFT_420000 [Tricladium varicosporioides]|nr:hypothetical protein BGZ60DRAFT_420000 [Hymenoscyphus varicosporioides]